MSGMADAACPRCHKRFGWAFRDSASLERPACPQSASRSRSGFAGSPPAALNNPSLPGRTDP